MSDIYLETFRGLRYKIKYKNIVDKYADQAVAKLKVVSPSQERVRNRKRGKYKDTWTTKVFKDEDDEYAVKVWNESNWQLTHLLENGHFIVNRKDGMLGWASPKPHIKPTAEEIKPLFVNAMEKAEIIKK